jgi:hypothetical protein
MKMCPHRRFAYRHVKAYLKPPQDVNSTDLQHDCIEHGVVNTF